MSSKKAATIARNDAMRARWRTASSDLIAKANTNLSITDTNDVNGSVTPDIVSKANKLTDYLNTLSHLGKKLFDQYHGLSLDDKTKSFPALKWDGSKDAAAKKKVVTAAVERLKAVRVTIMPEDGTIFNDEEVARKLTKKFDWLVWAEVAADVPAPVEVPATAVEDVPLEVTEPPEPTPKKHRKVKPEPQPAAVVHVDPEDLSASLTSSNFGAVQEPKSVNASPIRASIIVRAPVIAAKPPKRPTLLEYEEIDKLIRNEEMQRAKGTLHEPHINAKRVNEVTHTKRVSTAGNANWNVTARGKDWLTRPPPVPTRMEPIKYTRPTYQ